MPKAKGTGQTHEEAKRDAVKKLERMASSQGKVIKGNPSEKKVKPLLGGRLGYEVTVEAQFVNTTRQVGRGGRDRGKKR